MKWNVKDKKNIGYTGGTMIWSEFGYLVGMVEEHGIEHMFLLCLSLMDEQYREETMEVLKISHAYFKKLYPYPTRMEVELKEKDNYGGIGFIVNEYGFDHLYHTLLLWIKKRKIPRFLRTMLAKVGEFRKDHDDLYPVNDEHPYKVRGKLVLKALNYRFKMKQIL